MELTLDDLADALRNDLPPEEIGRHELTNGEWAVLRPLVPRPTTRRGSPRDSRQLLNGTLWILRTGAPWRDLPERYGPWRTVWQRFAKWRREGVLEAIRERLLERLNDAGRLDWDLGCVDGTSVRASRAAVGARKKGARRASRRIMRSDDREEDSGPRSTS